MNFKVYILENIRYKKKENGGELPKQQIAGKSRG